VAEHVIVLIGGIRADLEAVRALAQLRLLAKQLDWDLEIRGASDELRELLSFLGLPELGR
jgi:hypothetical protein